MLSTGTTGGTRCVVLHVVHTAKTIQNGVNCTAASSLLNMTIRTNTVYMTIATNYDTDAVGNMLNIQHGKKGTCSEW